MINKGFLKYIGTCAIYFILTMVICFYADQTTVWRPGWFSDKFFVFQYTTVFLLGSSFIKKKFNAFTFCRYGARKIFVLYQLLQHVILSLILVSLLFSAALVLTVVLGGATDFEIFSTMINQYGRFLIGSYLIGCLNMILEYSGSKLLNTGSQVFALLILAVELLVLVPKINQLSGVNIHIFFSWIFFKHTIGYCFLVGWSILLTIILFLVSRRGDLPI